jgi:hypothetical protein
MMSAPNRRPRAKIHELVYFMEGLRHNQWTLPTSEFSVFICHCGLNASRIAFWWTESVCSFLVCIVTVRKIRIRLGGFISMSINGLIYILYGMIPNETNISNDPRD